MSLMADEYAHFTAISKMLQTGNFLPRTGLSSLWGYHWAIVFCTKLVHNNSIEMIRLFTTILSICCVASFFFLAKTIDKDSAVQKAFSFLLLPAIFPFFFVIYTDVYAMMFVFLALFSALKNRLWFSGFFGILGMLVRQNNIIWLALIASLVYFQNYYPQYRWPDVRQWIRKFLFYFLALIALIVFAIWNKGFALDGREHHHLTVNVGNLFLFLFLFFFIFLPQNLMNARKMASFLGRHIYVGFILLVLFMVHVFFYDHYPQCNTFARFLHNWVVFWMTTPSFFLKTVTFLPVAYSILSLCVTPLQRKSFYLLYPFTALSLIVLPIIEIRYTFIPFVLFLLFKQKDSARVALVTLASYIVPIFLLMYLIWSGTFFP